MAKLNVTDLSDRSAQVQLTETDLSVFAEVVYQLDWTAVDMNKKERKAFESIIRVVDQARKQLGLEDR